MVLAIILVQPHRLTYEGTEAQEVPAPWLISQSQLVRKLGLEIEALCHTSLTLGSPRGRFCAWLVTFSAVANPHISFRNFLQTQL